VPIAEHEHELLDAFVAELQAAWPGVRPIAWCPGCLRIQGVTELSYLVLDLVDGGRRSLNPEGRGRKLAVGTSRLEDVKPPFEVVEGDAQVISATGFTGWWSG
jgi:hypothetical protein